MGSQSPLNVLVAEGVNVSILGMTIVFAVLILLWVILEIMNKVFNKQSETVAAAPAPAVPVQTAVASTGAVSDENLVGAICTAAVAASLGHTKFDVYSIKRSDS